MCIGLHLDIPYSVECMLSFKKHESSPFQQLQDIRVRLVSTVLPSSPLLID